MKKYIFYIVLITFIPFRIKAQQFADCSGAIKLNLLKTQEYKIEKLHGFGTKTELPLASPSNSAFFNGEHNVIWYKFTYPNSIELEFEIIPLNPADDIDFTIFEYKGTDFCNQLQNNIIEPIRTNLARKNSDKGITGLKMDANSNFVKPGMGSNYSKSLTINPQYHYYLIIDNINSDNGVIIKFNKPQKPLIGGIVSHKNSGEFLDAEIILKNNCNGNIIFNSKTNKTDGKFEIKAPPTDCDFYQLSVSKKGFMYEIYTIPKSAVLSGKANGLDIKMEQLQINNSYKLRNLNFEPGSDELIDKADIALYALYVLMKENPTMRIKIEGHVHWLGNSQASPDGEKMAIKLSEDRAKKVMEYLISAEVEVNRIEIEGLGASKMLFKSPRNAKEEEQNRRVEIKVLSF